MRKNSQHKKGSVVETPAADEAPEQQPILVTDLMRTLSEEETSLLRLPVENVFGNINCYNQISLLPHNI